MSDRAAAVTGLAVFIAGMIVILTRREHRDTITAWAIAAAGSFRRCIRGTPAGCGRHSAAAFTVALDAILAGQPLAIEAAPTGRPADPGPRRQELMPLGVDRHGEAGRPNIRGEEPTDDDRYYARQAHGYIPQLDPDHIGLPDDATIRLTPIQQNIALAWDQAGINERTRAWTPRAVTA